MSFLALPRHNKLAASLSLSAEDRQSLAQVLRVLDGDGVPQRQFESRSPRINLNGL
jgi:hypothetical protein